jgi:hypothetical protein
MLTLMTWNVENLFLPGSPSGPKTQQIYDETLQAEAKCACSAEAHSGNRVLVKAGRKVFHPGRLR